jgi:S-formylglutathione hydrolase FrmB
MTLDLIDGSPGPPWERPLAGTLDRLTVQSEVLADNPLGDPALRPLYVYHPPGVTPAQPVPAVYVIQGYTGQLDAWLSRSAFEPTFPERLDAMFASGGCPPVFVVMVDAWTSIGGSQFLNSAATGRYLDYLCDEVVPFVDRHYPTLPDADHRAITGKSSGGYGAMVVPMLRPGVFGALNSHSGDALFEVAYLPGFPRAARDLRDRFDGSLDVFRRQFAGADPFDYGHFGAVLEAYGYACAYSPDPGAPGGARLPFDSTGRLNDEVWARWLTHDPVRMVAEHADTLRGMRAILLEAGRGDEYFLDLGAEAMAAELTRHGIAHELELFDGRHGGIGYRYPPAIARLAAAIS